jgi:pantoate--beta-alanine ligase
MDHDIKLLESVECDVLFSPEVEEMYPQGEAVTTMDFGILETVMEGKDRPGHFNGVGIIVKKLFEIILPDKAYFGKKDYQQLAIIRLLTKQFQLSPEIIGCDIVRESDGLAMSSRNQRLSAEERSLAPAIYQILTQAVSMQYSVGVPEIRAWVKQQINANPLFDLVYFEIADSQTLETIHQWDKNQKSHAFIVVNVGDVRLIDNLPFDK